MSITAIVENDTIKLPAGIHLPDGTRVQIEAQVSSKTKPWMELAGCLAGEAEELRRIGQVDWSKSAAVTNQRDKGRVLAAGEVASLFDELRG